MESTPPITINPNDRETVDIRSSEVDPTNGIKKEPTKTNIGSTIFNDPDNANRNPINVDSSELETDQSPQRDGQPPENADNRLVLYDSEQTSLVPESSSRFHSRTLPSIGVFTVQCSDCLKWRLIPTQEKYEQIREHLLEKPFNCDTAREWRPEISCDDPTDISQDGSRLWAIDKPNIAQPPPGWQRLLRIRAEGGTRFADVYYVTPSSKRLRSMIEVEKYLSENPRYVEEGVKLSQFSFQTPKPLQENYVKKRPTRPALPNDGNGPGASGLAEPSEVNPITWVSPVDTEFHHEDPKLANADGDASRAELSNEQKRRKA